MDYKRQFSLLTLAALVGLVSCQQGGAPEGQAEMEHSTDIEDSMSGMDHSSMEQGDAHSDHDPRHGGTFFMALDEIHHLEGTLAEPDLFRVYLYDQFTVPLGAEKIEEVSGAVHWGEFPDPPAMPLATGPEESMLEVQLDRKPEFPVTLTLQLRFPGMGADSDPELFTFMFDEFSQP
jgi:hypothetical protein